MRCQAPDCGVEFEPQRSTARYHSATCRQRAGRARKAAAAEAKAKQVEGSTAEHGLVRAVRKDLEDATALDTVPGQLALQFARRIANPEESSLSALSKELRALMAEAKAAAAPAEGPAPTEPDEVTRARQARERKASEASTR